MRIGIVAPPWIPVPPPSYGGTESVVHTLAVGLAEAGHDVVLAASGDSTCPVPRVPNLSESSGLCMDSGRQEILHVLRAYEAMQDVDVVHDHTLLGPLCRRKGPDVPRVTTLHGPFDDELTQIYRAMHGEASLVAISQHQASTARGVKIDAVIHHGIDLRSVRFSPSHNGGACFLGRMHPSKGLLQAIMVARLAGIPLRIGAKMREPFEQEYFHDVIEPLLGADIEYLGELGTADKYRLLGESVALLNPIQWPEPFGMVMIEALAAGTPVVATRRGSAPEIISDGETGFLADSLQGLAESLRGAGWLRRNDCRRAAEQHFSSQRMVREYIRFYSGLLAGSPRAAEEQAAAGF
ncbi:glycosyltransferase family 4 protein [Arthrobacter sp. Y81]|uniref:glycosyltransferase family 4 protein n=1 Tax=Arthrobacter sp. Y81 TaxID=2058897 RepID=UPI000CE50BDF|nr:glycosyltransferase family 4 protein [Arthrobacter sp. Y81]